MQLPIHQSTTRTPWNKGKLRAQRPPLRLPEIWANYESPPHLKIPPTHAQQMVCK